MNSFFRFKNHLKPLFLDSGVGQSGVLVGPTRTASRSGNAHPTPTRLGRAPTGASTVTVLLRTLYGIGNGNQTIPTIEFKPAYPDTLKRLETLLTGQTTEIGERCRAIRANWRVIGPTSGILVQSESARPAEKESVSPSVGFLFVSRWLNWLHPRATVVLFAWSTWLTWPS